MKTSSSSLFFDDLGNSWLGRFQPFLWALLVAAVALAIYFRLGAEVADDGAFFLRYAENITRGEFWVWNAGEAPVWGASNPFYPIVLAPFLTLGFSPYWAVVGAGLLLTSITVTVTARTLFQGFGAFAAVFFVVLFLLDSRLIYWSASGLETPMTLLLLSLALYRLLNDAGSLFTVCVGVLLFTSKLDLVPFGVYFLCSLWWLDRGKSIFNIASIALVSFGFYVFAWYYFGAPVPNSFLTKAFHQNFGDLTATWFSTELTFGLERQMCLVMSLLCLAFFRALGIRQRVFIVFAFAGIATHWLAYTMKYPIEPYNWYTLPAAFLIIITGSVGGGLLYQLALSRSGPVKFAVAAILLLVFAFSVLKIVVSETEITRGVLRLAAVESVRADAGRWVDHNTPDDFVVFSMWGNPAFYSNRRSIDGSFLNMPYVEGSAITEFKPDVIFVRDRGSSPMEFKFAHITPDERAPYTPVAVCSNRDTETDWHVVTYTILVLSSELQRISFDSAKLGQCSRI